MISLVVGALLGLMAWQLGQAEGQLALCLFGHLIDSWAGLEVDLSLVVLGPPAWIVMMGCRLSVFSLVCPQKH